MHRSPVTVFTIQVARSNPLCELARFESDPMTRPGLRDAPFHALRKRFFYGWAILGVGECSETGPRSAV